MHLARRQVRYVAAAASAAMAVIYFLIGLGVLSIGGSQSGEMVDLFVFGVSAGSAFLVLAGLLALTDRRWLWVLAAIFQVWVFAIYFFVAGSREPPFEIWGVTLRVLQVVLFAGLVWLSWSPAQPEPQSMARRVTP
jgi:peptidoglycan/LPS O-acetylase OafA/YrhL